MDSGGLIILGFQIVYFLRPQFGLGRLCLVKTLFCLVVALHIASGQMRHMGFKQSVGRINIDTSVQSSLKALFSLITFIFIKRAIL